LALLVVGTVTTKVGAGVAVSVGVSGATVPLVVGWRLAVAVRVRVDVTVG
jgi:hypothetical protein